MGINFLTDWVAILYLMVTVQLLVVTKQQTCIKYFLSALYYWMHDMCDMTPRASCLYKALTTNRFVVYILHIVKSVLYVGEFEKRVKLKQDDIAGKISDMQFLQFHSHFRIFHSHSRIF